MLGAILNCEHVVARCIQETKAVFPWTSILSMTARGREAAFLICSGVTCTPIPGVLVAVLIRWRNFQGIMCVCSHNASHVGLSEVDRPLIVVGDANIWYPEFSLGRSPPLDDLIVPLVDL